MIKYKLIKKHEAPELSTLEKSGMKVEINLADTLRNFEYNKKQIEAIEAELKLKKALIINIVTNYPDVVKIEDKMQIACHTYYETNRYVAIAEEKLIEFKEAQKELEEEINEIKKQTGISKLSAEEVAKISKSIKEKVESGKVDLTKLK